MRSRARLKGTGALLALSSLLVLVASAGTPRSFPLLGVRSSGAALTGIHKIQHVVVIMQENRSFDSYFGTFPGANGIPMANGVPTVCVPDPQRGGCQTSVRRPHRRQRRRPARRARSDARTSTAGRWTASSPPTRRRSKDCIDPEQSRTARSGPIDVMGYHTAERHPELLELRQELRAPGPHVRAGRVVEPARAPVPGVGVVGARARKHNDPNSCDNQMQTPGPKPPHDCEAAPGRLARHADLRVDRPDVPPAPAERVVGLLRRDAAPSPTAQNDSALELRARATRTR